MAKPRVFISSTYYDLKSLRSDLEHFIKERGYDPVLNERGSVTYTKEQSPEESCYREIESCDILVSIIGGRFGSASNRGPYSISQVELKTAIEQYKQVYIFVERDVLSEWKTYSKNKDANVEWVSVNDVSIFKFLDEILSLPNNNPVMPFDTSHEIIGLLREQWAGLFQRMLLQAAAEGQTAAARELRQGLDTLHQLVAILSKKVEGADALVSNVLLADHPIFGRVRKLLKVPYRVFFTNKDELTTWLKTRGWGTLVEEEVWDEPNIIEWLKSDDHVYDLFKMDARLFDSDGRLIVQSLAWDDNLVRREVRPKETDFDSSDDVPF